MQVNEADPCNYGNPGSRVSLAVFALANLFRRHKEKQAENWEDSELTSLPDGLEFR